MEEQKGALGGMQSGPSMQQQSGDQKSGPGALIAIIIILIVLVVGGFYFFGSPGGTPTRTQMDEQNPEPAGIGESQCS